MFSKKWLTPLFFFALITTSLTATCQQNIIKNGLFKQGLFSWSPYAPQSTSAKIEYSNSYSEYDLSDSHIGTYFVELDRNSGLQQKITAQPGEMYDLSFAYALRKKVGPIQLIIKNDDIVLLNKVFEDTTEVRHFHYTHIQFKVKKKSSVLKFYIKPTDHPDKGLLISDIFCIKSGSVNLNDFKSIRY
jgi:hypothetical protein